MAIEYSEANAGTGGTKFAHDNITEGVNTLAVPYTKLMSGTDGDKSVIPCDSVNGLDVDVTRVSGNVTVVQATASNLNASVVQSGSWAVTLNAGTNNIGDVDVASLPTNSLANGNLVHIDYDTGAGTQNLPVVGFGLPASGGAVAGGTSSNPIRVDPTGTTTQPISGTVNANQSGSWSVTNLGSGKSLKLAAVSLTTTGTIVPAVSGKRIKVYRYAIQGRNDGVTLQFRDGSAGSSLSIEWIFNAREGVSSGSVSPPEFLFGTSAGNSLDGVVTGIGTVWVEVSYFDDDAS